MNAKLLRAVDDLIGYYENGDGGIEWETLDELVSNLITARDEIDTIILPQQSGKDLRAQQ